MIVKAIICDHCGRTIEEEHPVRINIEEYSTEASNSYGARFRGYKSVLKMHLCDSCNSLFKEFMGIPLDVKGAENADGCEQ